MDIRPTLSIEAAVAWRPGLAGLGDEDLLAWYDAVVPQLRPDCRILEIGVWRGRSLGYAATLLERLGWEAACIYGVDPYRYPAMPGDSEGCTVSYRDALTSITHHLTEAELGRVHLLRCTSAEAWTCCELSALDLVMIDADHSYVAVARDIRLWRECLRPGGLLAGHDHAPEFPGVVDAVRDALGGGARTWGTVWWTEIA